MSKGIISNIRVFGSSWNANKLNFPADRILIKAMPSNVDTIWVDNDGTAKEDWCFPLAAGESVTLHIKNLNQLDILFMNSADKVIFVHEVGPETVKIEDNK